MEKFVLVRIADRVNRKWGRVSWYSLARGDCELSIRGTTKILNRLIAWGVLEIVEPARGTRSRRYHINQARLASGQPGRPLRTRLEMNPVHH